MDPWLAYILGMFTIPVLSLIYIGIVLAIEGQEPWRQEQLEQYQLEHGPRNPSEEYWKMRTEEWRTRPTEDLEP